MYGNGSNCSVHKYQVLPITPRETTIPKKQPKLEKEKL